MRTKTVPRLLLALFLISTLIMSAGPASSITKKDVDQACAASSEAKGRYDAAKAALDETTAAHQELWRRIDDLSYKMLGARATIDDRADEIDGIRERVIDRAIQMYMSGGFEQPKVMLAAGSVEELIAGRAFLDAATKEDVASVERLEVLRRELERLHAEFQAQTEELAIAESDMALVEERQAEAAAEADAVWRDLNSDCQTAWSEWNRQEAMRKAQEAARRGGGGGGIGAEATPGFICPMGAPVSFINDWGFARSGGRRHKGTDIFAAHGHAVVAVADGTIRLTSGYLGGTAVWVNADYGVSFYYAHLSGYAPGIANGVRVAKGQVIGYNGDSGNARGGAPHVHFQIHPGGSSRPAVNPYPTLARSC